MLSKVRYERVPKDLVDKIREVEQEIQKLKEKLRKLKNLGRELKETEKSKLDELLPRISEVLGNEMVLKLLNFKRRLWRSTLKLKEKQEYIEKYLLPIIQGDILRSAALRKKQRLEKQI